MHTSLKSKKSLFVVLLAVGLIFRISFSTFGYNNDVDAYYDVSGIAERGGNVYQESSRYNYAPLWLWTLSGLREISEFIGNLDSFRYFVTGFLWLILV